MTKYADFYRRSLDDRDAFWREQAGLIDWNTPPRQICDYSNPPFARWYLGGTTNLCHNAEVQRTAAMLKELGVRKGDRVLIYMPMIAQAAFTMLACVRIGAIHSVVFGGFASASVASRIEDAAPKLIVSADAGSRGGKVVEYKPLLDEAIRLSSHKPEAVLLVDRGLSTMKLIADRDHLWGVLRQRHLDSTVPCEWLESNEISYTIYT